MAYTILKLENWIILKKIKRKTAILIAFACVAGSIVADASNEDIRSAFSYGYYLG